MANKNESVEFFVRFLNDRFGDLKSKLDELFKWMTLDESPKKAEAVTEAIKALDHLKKALSATDYPSWMNPLTVALGNYKQHLGKTDVAGFTYLKSLLQIYPAIDAHRWTFRDEEAPSIDFMSIYRSFYDSSRVPELFDQLVNHLEEIIRSGELDSVKTIKKLEELIATIRKNARGDYFSTRGVWEFTRVYIKNLVIAVAEDTPILKHAVGAMKQTMHELDIEMATVLKQINSKFAELGHSELPMLSYHRKELPSPVVEGELIEPPDATHDQIEQSNPNDN